MQFHISVAELERLFKATVERPRKTDTVTLSACASYVFVECRGDIAGMKAAVHRDGSVTLKAKKFRDFLRTYKDMEAPIFEGSADGLRIKTLPIPVAKYDSKPKPPTEFSGAREHPDMADLK